MPVVFLNLAAPNSKISDITYLKKSECIIYLCTRSQIFILISTPGLALNPSLLRVIFFTVHKYPPFTVISQLYLKFLCLLWISLLFDPSRVKCYCFSCPYPRIASNQYKFPTSMQRGFKTYLPNVFILNTSSSTHVSTSILGMRELIVFAIRSVCLTDKHLSHKSCP